MRRRHAMYITVVAAVGLILGAAGTAAQGPQLEPLAGGEGKFHFLTPSPADEPATLQVRFTLEDTSGLEALWIGFGDSAEAAPALLSLVWTEDRSGWFPVWAVHLQTDAELFGPGVSAKSGAGVLAGSKVVSLHNAQPRAGHLYQVELSYDPANGVIAAGLTDLTEGERLFAREVPVGRPEGPLYPAIGALGGEITIQSAAAYGYSVPLGAAWDLMVRDGDRYTRLALYRLTPEIEMALRLVGPGEYAGKFVVRVQGPAGTVTLMELSGAARGEELLVPFKATDLPLGPLTLEVAYIDEAGTVWVLGGRSLLNVAATLEVRFDEMKVEDGDVTGVLVVASSDHRVENLPVQLSAHVAEVGKDAAAVPVLSTTLASVDKAPVRLPFTVPLPAAGNLFSLSLDVEFGVPVGVVSSQSQFHVLRIVGD